MARYLQIFLSNVTDVEVLKLGPDISGDLNWTISYFITSDGLTNLPAYSSIAMNGTAVTTIVQNGTASLGGSIYLNVSDSLGANATFYTGSIDVYDILDAGLLYQRLQELSSDIFYGCEVTVNSNETITGSLGQAPKYFDVNVSYTIVKVVLTPGRRLCKSISMIAG